VTHSIAVTRGLATPQLSVNGILPDQAGEIQSFEVEGGTPGVDG
jgi:hypothetical protein